METNVDDALVQYERDSAIVLMGRLLDTTDFPWNWQINWSRFCSEVVLLWASENVFDIKLSRDNHEEISDDDRVLQSIAENQAVDWWSEVENYLVDITVDEELASSFKSKLTVTWRDVEAAKEKLEKFKSKDQSSSKNCKCYSLFSEDDIISAVVENTMLPDITKKKCCTVFCFQQIKR
jgi:hypothetical protein